MVLFAQDPLLLIAIEKFDIAPRCETSDIAKFIVHIIFHIVQFYKRNTKEKDTIYKRIVTLLEPLK